MAISDATCTVWRPTQPVASASVTDGGPELDREPEREPAAAGAIGALGALERLEPPTPRRPNRFDRPPEPHDWRWVVGGIGRTLISVGILMFAFVAYQLWGTGIQTAQAQNRLESRFEELLAAQTTVAVATTTTLEATPSTVPESTTVAPTTVAPTTAAPTTVPPAAIEPPPEGDPVAQLQIDSIGLDWTAVEGVRAKDLADGPGHFPETPLPGQLGNSAFAGHRTTHGQPFYDIDKIEVGDQIVVTTLAGRFVYVVTGTRVVGKDDYAAVIPTVDPTTATLTLTSCHPKFSTQKRYVVQAELDPTLSGQVTAPVEDLPPPSEDQPTDVSLVDPTVDSTPGPDTTDLATAAPTDTTPTAAAPSSSDTGASEDVFQNRWFADDAAFAQVALWGLALTAISLGAWRLSRRVRRNWVGALVGIVPFVVVLYFWFENVNRLLPANL